MFVALLFLPLMRWLHSKKIPKPISILIVIIIIGTVLKICGELIQLSSNEILSADNAFFDTARIKLSNVLISIESFFGIQRLGDENVISHYLQQNSLMSNIGPTFGFVKSTITMTLTTTFFVVLLLSESINFQKIMNSTLFQHKHSSVKTFLKVENDIIKFVKVKFVISLITGIGFSLACLFFDVSFPIFWGLFAFLINFVQMIGSIVSVLLLSLFALVELDSTGTLLFFILAITGVQVLMGSIIEPVFMGKVFSINVITILVMLMLWGYIWGIPGLIMSIPITVFIKIILEQFPGTKGIAAFMSGSQTER
jgi:predicted PurR-regulated permease PerM